MAVEIEEVKKKLKNPYILGAVLGGGAILLFMAFSRKQQTESVEDVYLESYPTPTPEMTYPKGGGEATIIPDITAVIAEMQRLQAEQNLVIGELFATTMADIMEGFSSISEQMNQQLKEISRTTTESIQEVTRVVAESARERSKESKSAGSHISKIEPDMTRQQESKPVVITTRSSSDTSRNIPLRDYFAASGYKVEYIKDTQDIRVYDPKTGHSAMISKGVYDIEKGKSYVSENVLRKIEDTIQQGRYKLPGY